MGTGAVFEQPIIDTSVKRYYVLKTNGIANLRAINVAVASHKETPSFWLPGYMSPKKLRSHTVLRKQFLYYDYAFVALYDPLAFEEFLLERKIPAYFLRVPGTKLPSALSEEEIQRVKQLESFKQTEVEEAVTPLGIKLGSLIEVSNGPFIGCRGAVVEVHPNYVVLEMNVFGRPTRVNVNLEFLSNVLRCDPETLPTDDDADQQ